MRVATSLKWLCGLAAVVALATPPSAATAAAATAAPLIRIGVGGQLKMGIGGALMRAGIPFDYLTLEDQLHASALAKYDLLYMAGLNAGADDFINLFDAELGKYIQNGGHAIIETDIRPGEALRDLPRRRHSGMDHFVVHLEPGSNPLADIFGADHAWDYYGDVAPLDLPQDQGYQILARVDGPEAAHTPFIFTRKYGQGEVMALAGDVAYVQGNWHPFYQDLLLALVKLESGGRAVPQWRLSNDNPVGPYEDAPAVDADANLAAAATDELAKPARAAKPNKPPKPPTPDARDLGLVCADGYCLRCTPPANGVGRLYLDGGASVELSASEVRLLGRGKKASAELKGAKQVDVARFADGVAACVDGAKLAFVPAKLDPQGHVFAAGESLGAELQPAEPVAFGDDFAAAGELSNEWTREGGDWSLSGQNPDRSKVPGFALSGGNGSVAAGAWFWSRYRCAVSLKTMGAAAVELQIARADANHYLAARLTPGKPGKLELVRHAGADVATLASGPAMAPDGQWLRLGVARGEQQLEAVLDCQVVCNVASPDALLGGIGLKVDGAAAMFDDVEAVDAAYVPPQTRVHPLTMDKGSSGLLDHDTWAPAAAAWIPTAQPGEFVHRGRFVGDFRISLPLVAAGPNPRVCLTASLLRDSLKPVVTVSGKPSKRCELVVARRGGRWSASLDGKHVGLKAGPAGSTCLGLRFADVSLAAEDVVLTADDVAETMFQNAPVDWWEDSGTWQVTSRWRCQPQWSWLCGRPEPARAVLRSKRKVTGDLVIDAPLGPQMWDGHEHIDGFRISFAADATDPESGYTVQLCGDGDGLCQLMRGKDIVATSEKMRPYWRETHNTWFRVRIERCGATISAWLQGRLLFTWTDPQPLGDGHVYLWSERNAVMTPCLSVYGRQIAPTQP